MNKGKAGTYMEYKDRKADFNNKKDFEEKATEQDYEELYAYFSNVPSATWDDKESRYYNFSRTSARILLDEKGYDIPKNKTSNSEEKSEKLNIQNKRLKVKKYTIYITDENIEKINALYEKYAEYELTPKQNILDAFLNFAFDEFEK